MLRRLGYGDFSLAPRPGPRLFSAFAARLPRFHQALARGEFFGNHRIAADLERLLA